MADEGFEPRIALTSQNSTPFPLSPLPRYEENSSCGLAGLDAATPEAVCPMEEL